MDGAPGKRARKQVKKTNYGSDSDESYAAEAGPSSGGGGEEKKLTKTQEKNRRAQAKYATIPLFCVDRRPIFPLHSIPLPAPACASQIHRHAISHSEWLPEWHPAPCACLRIADTWPCNQSQ